MAENAVEHDFYSEPFRRYTKRFKIIFRAEHGVDFFVIRRVVTVVALRLKYRVEINAGNAEAFEVAELLLNSL